MCYLLTILLLSTSGCLRSGEEEQRIDYNNLETIVQTTTTNPQINATTTTTSTTSTTVERSRCPDCRNYKCEICPKCPSCNYEMTEEQIHWLLNDCRSRDSESPAVQAGEAKACQRILEYFKVPGRPKFSMEPSRGISDYYRSTQRTLERDEYCFKNLGGYFIINRTEYFQGENNVSRKMWGWNDDSCLSSSITIRDL